MRGNTYLRNTIRWVLKTFIIIIAVFIGLIVMDYFFAPEWLTDSVAFCILALSFFVYVLISTIKAKHSHKATKRQRVDFEIDDLNLPEKKHTKKHLKILKPVLAIVLIFLIVILGFNILGNREIEDIPQNVIEFGEKYPEASDYVKNFNKYKNKDFDMDVSEEMTERKIPLFIQWDKRWGYKDYGGNYVGVAGCGPTCVAMVACGLEQDAAINPYVVSQYAAQQGFYTYGQGTSWDIMTTGAKHFGLDVSAGSVSADYILNNLTSSTPLICSMTPGDFTKTGHFIVLTGVTDDGQIIVNDPNSSKNSKRHWNVDTLVSQMKSVWKYSYNQ